MSGPMTAFWLDPATPIDRLREGFWQERIAIPLTDWPDGRIIRVSTHFYNTEAEIDRLVGVMARLRLLPGG
jgi:selenocysteine lyase/cysteine desulfurase